MLKSAAAKLAHNSTIPALAGNKALRPLQDLITSEKAIITSLAQLSLHFSRASEALRIWAQGEGDDLSDTLGASTKLLLEFSAALTKFAVHEQTIREHMKAIRTEEESLDALKNRRRTVGSKADSAERKLSKMDPTHKDIPAQTAQLERLRDAMRELDSEIMIGEAKLGHLKRTATMAWMTLKYGGLEECCRKGLMIAEAGKLVMAELPQQVTEPGLSRPFYTGNVRTEAYVAEALRALNEVSIDASSPSGRMQFPLPANYQGGDPKFIPPAFPDSESTTSVAGARSPGDGDGPPQYRVQYSLDAPKPSFEERSDQGRAFQADEYGSFLPQLDSLRFQSLNTRKPAPPPTASMFLGDGGAQQIRQSAPSGGRFATFPVKGKREDPAGLAVAEPLVGSRSSSDVERAPPGGDSDDVAPRIEGIEGTRTPPPGPPPGAAPPAMHASIYGGYDPSFDPDASFDPGNGDEKEDDSQLPYTGLPRIERKPTGSRPLPMPRPNPSLFYRGEAGPVEEPNGFAPLFTEPDSIPDFVQAPLAPQGESTSPVAVQAADPDDERALNAAAAREVARELDTLMYQPPTVVPRDPSPQPSTPTPSPLSIPPVASTPARSSSDSVTQPSSPFTSARGRVSGSPTTPRSSVDYPPQGNIPSPPRVALTPSSSPTQRARLPPPSIALPRSASPSLSGINTPPFRTPPELPPSPTVPSAQRTLPPSPAVPLPPGKAPPFPRQGSGMISAAAFRRPAPRKASEPLVGTRDVSPLSIRKKDVRGTPSAPRTASNSISSLSGVQLSEPAASQPQGQPQEDEFDYIAAYYSSGGDEGGLPYPGDESRGVSNGLR
ncbi:hypothetical protein BC827DRAFT_1183818 [Russula dissimulans]|nr:hypothetical protein BC827DRAFT_1183818 [Russula dissimulans]